jgi:hypothetical protein
MTCFGDDLACSESGQALLISHPHIIGIAMVGSHDQYATGTLN